MLASHFSPLQIKEESLKSSILKVIEMNLFSLFLPWMLLVHNTVDFRENGAQEEYLHILNYTVTEYIGMLEDNNRIKLVNKTGWMGDKICKLSLLFQSYEKQDVDTSRQMILTLIDSFVKAINEGCRGRLKPFLENCTFTSCDVEIRVNYIDDCKYPYPFPGTVKYVAYADGYITYSTENPRCLGLLEPLRRETLCFARQLATPVQPLPFYCP